MLFVFPQGKLPKGNELVCERPECDFKPTLP